jgi:glycosyltransferase involved in cell wall biosynthesis
MIPFDYIYAGAILIVLLALAVMVAVNLRVLPTTTDYVPLLASQPSVAVLIPARNEAANIEACLHSLQAQDYPNLQIWLYNDQSTDDTAVIARLIAPVTTQSTIHVMDGKSPPPRGWLGKANALHNLYAAVRAESDPDYILFTDADVTFEPGAVSQAIATAIAWRAGLLSIFPRQIVLTLAERLAVPIALHWTVYDFLPLPVAFNTDIPAFAAANGQFMLFTCEAYDACGGHAAVRDNILEDVSLARAVKQAGYRAILADGGSTIYTRMYKGASEVWRGYSKNAYAFFGYNPLLLIVGVIVLMALYVFPPILALLAFMAGNLTLGALFVAQYLIAVQTRLLLATRFVYPLPGTFLHPVAILFFIAIQLNSLRWHLTKQANWKGRTLG